MNALDVAVALLNAKRVELLVSPSTLIVSQYFRGRDKCARRDRPISARIANIIVAQIVVFFAHKARILRAVVLIVVLFACASERNSRLYGSAR